MHSPLIRFLQALCMLLLLAAAPLHAADPTAAEGVPQSDTINTLK